MEEVHVETGVDDLISLLKSHEKIGIKEAANALKIDESFVQSWVDFLVEENIVGIEYKFTKPFIFLNDSKTTLSENEEPEEEQTGLVGIKNQYLKNAKDHQIPEDKALLLWKKHLKESLEKRKDFFYREAAKRSLDPDKMYAQYLGTILKV